MKQSLSLRVNALIVWIICVSLDESTQLITCSIKRQILRVLKCLRVCVSAACGKHSSSTEGWPHPCKPPRGKWAQLLAETVLTELCWAVEISIPLPSVHTHTLQYRNTNLYVCLCVQSCCVASGKNSLPHTPLTFAASFKTSWIQNSFTLWPFSTSSLTEGCFQHFLFFAKTSFQNSTFWTKEMFKSCCWFF